MARTYLFCLVIVVLPSGVVASEVTWRMAVSVDLVRNPSGIASMSIAAWGEYAE